MYTATALTLLSERRMCGSSKSGPLCARSSDVEPKREHRRTGCHPVVSFLTFYLNAACKHDNGDEEGGGRE